VKWTQADAIELCRQIEALCPAFGCHVALTGGLLYKDGERKDADILFYRIRDVEEIDLNGLFAAMKAIGVHADSDQDHGEYGPDLWCIKATHGGRPIDFFFPDWSSDRAAALDVPESDSDDAPAFFSSLDIDP
jgi:hypothetical protein